MNRLGELLAGVTALAGIGSWAFAVAADAGHPFAIALGVAAAVAGFSVVVNAPELLKDRRPGS